MTLESDSKMFNFYATLYTPVLSLFQIPHVNYGCCIYIKWVNINQQWFHARTRFFYWNQESEHGASMSANTFSLPFHTQLLGFEFSKLVAREISCSHGFGARAALVSNVLVWEDPKIIEINGK